MLRCLGCLLTFSHDIYLEQADSVPVNLLSETEIPEFPLNHNTLCPFSETGSRASSPFVILAGSNVMKSIHGVGELMTQVVLRGGGLLPTTPTHQPQGDVVKTQTEPEREDIMVMDTKLKIIEILQVRHQEMLPQTVWVDV